MALPCFIIEIRQMFKKILEIRDKITHSTTDETIFFWLIFSEFGNDFATYIQPCLFSSRPQKAKNNL